MKSGLILLFLASSCQSQPTNAEEPIKVLVQSVGNTYHPMTDWYPGTLAAAKQAAISTRISANVRSVPVEVGQKVRKGALLLRLADEDLRSQLVAAHAELDAASASARRIETLAAQGQATGTELEAAVARRAQSQAQFDTLKENLSYASIRAPFDGTVQSKTVSAGDLVTPGQSLLVLQGTGLEVTATLDEPSARSLRIGQTVRFEAGDRAGTAVVSVLAPGADPISHRSAIRAQVALNENLKGLRTGDFVRLSIPLYKAVQEYPHRVWVPKKALVERGDLTGVFVVREGRAELRWLALGEPSGDDIQVRAGIKPGEEVVTQLVDGEDGSPVGLKDGQRVEVNRAK